MHVIKVFLFLSPPPKKIYTEKLAKKFQILAKSANLHYKRQLPNYFVKKKGKKALHVISLGYYVM
jgi:hypothetical protein